MNKRFNISNILMLCLMVLATWCFTACEDKSMGGSNTLGFPTDTLFMADPGTEVNVTFNVGYDWEVVSDKQWCKIDGEYLSDEGRAGKNTVTFVVGKTGNLSVADTAVITLTMNNDSRTLARIVRNAVKKNYVLEIKDSARVYANGESIAIGMTGQKALDLELNFNVDQLKYEFPEWIKMSREGKTITLNVAEESLKYIINNEDESLYLYKDSTVRRSYHVQYVGMDPQYIAIEGAALKQDVIVTQDAKYASINGEKCDLSLLFTITTLEDEFRVIALSLAEDGSYKVVDTENEDSCWISMPKVGSISKDKVMLEIKKANEGLNERTMHFFALPMAIAENLDCDETVLEFFCEMGDEASIRLKDSAEQYRMVTIVQDGEAYITIDPEARWGVKVTADGTGYFDAIRGDTCYTPMEVDIETSRGYELICASYDTKVGYELMNVDDSWLVINDDKQGNVEISFKANTGNERTLCLFALPLPIVESLDPESSEYLENLSNMLFTKDSISEIRVDEEVNAEVYVIARFVQEPNEGNSIKVLKKGVESVEVTKETDAEWLKIAANPNDSLSGVAPSKVFHCSMKLGYSYVINPLIPLDEWGGGEGFQEDKRGIEIYGKSGKKYEPGKGNDYVDDYGLMEEIEGNYMLVTLTADRKKMTEEFIIYFIDSERNCLKALVVTLL